MAKKRAFWARMREWDSIRITARRALVREVAGLVLAGLVLAGPVPAAAGFQQRTSVPTSLVFDGVTVVDVESGKLVPSQRVVITGNRIQAVGGTDAVTVPAGAQVVNAKGKYLIPGLWDMHIHLEAKDGDGALSYPLMVANGITGFREAGSSMPLDTLVRWRREILAGTRVGPPRQLLSGQAIDERSLCTRGGSSHTCVTAGDASDARHLIDSLKAAGADVIKTYDLSSDMYFTVAAEARRIGIPIGGHTSVPAIAASDSGARLIDHTTLNRELANACLYGEEASVERCRPLAGHFARRHTWWVPTWINMPVAGRERTAWIYAEFRDFLAKFWAGFATSADLGESLRRAIAVTDGSSPPESPFFGGPRPRPAGGTTPDTAGYLYVARQAGLPLVAGTDAVGIGFPEIQMLIAPPLGFTFHAELATYVAEGLTPLEALQAATLTPAKVINATDTLGTVAAGKLADLVLLDGDPLADITNTAAIRGVLANGRYFDRATLDGLLTDVRKIKAQKRP